MPKLHIFELYYPADIHSFVLLNPIITNADPEFGRHG